MDAYDIRFPLGASMILSGPSLSGKTTFVIKIIENIESIFKTIPTKIRWFYGATPPPLTINNTAIETYDHLPSEKDINNNELIVIDDFMKEGPDTNLFTKVAHHKNCFIIFITQNIFSKQGRTATLNAHYLVLFKNPRDKTQIRYLAQQMYPGKHQFLVDAFKDGTDSRPYGCILIDLRQETPEHIRVRGSPFVQPIEVYLSKL